MTELITPRRTKLRPPRLSADLLPRPRLFARLNALPSLALIVAPAGYGKTTLIAMWLAQVGLLRAWLSLDAEDNDPLQFLLNVVTALRTIFPAWGEDLLGLLTAPNRPPFPVIGLTVINELDALEQEFVLVLDDYHVVTDPVIHEWLARLAAHPPRALHLVIASRHDTVLPWGVRLRGAICEIRQGELNFTRGETTTFLENALSRPVDERAITAILQRSVGWVTSVRLLALYLRQRPNVRSWDEALGGSEQFVIDYLASAVFENLPEMMRRFLLHTSILDRVSGPLGDRLMDGVVPAGSVLLQQLEADGIFTSMLDEEGVWYRYHPLFRRTLRRILMAEVAPQVIAGLYERAATWHESQGWYEEAIGLLVSGKQVAAAAAVAGRHRHELLDRQDYHRLEHWLTLFPADAVLGEIELLFIKAYVDQVQFRMHDLTMILQQIDTLLSVTPAELPQIGEWRGEVASLRALITSLRSDGPQTLTSGLYALEHIMPGSFIARAMALLHAAYGYQMSGELEHAYALLDVSANTTLITRDIAVLRSRTLRLYVDLVAGDLMAMRDAFPLIIDLAKSAALATTAAWAHYFYATACYLQNDLAAAEQHFGAVVGLELSAHSLCYVHSAIGLALTYQAQGRPDAAARGVASAREYALRMQNRDLSELVDAAVAELEVRRGLLAGPLAWVAALRHDQAMDVVLHFYLPVLAPAKVLTASGTDADLAAASVRLARAAGIAERTHNNHLLLQVKVLEATLAETLGDRERALAALAAAVRLAEPGAAQRPFLDQGPIAGQLIGMLLVEGIEQEFVERLHRAFVIEHGASDVHVGKPPEPAASRQSERMKPRNTSEPGSNDLRVVLTNRELDILYLLLQRFTNKEIARNLGISTETVKGHLVSLFRKLEVKNRRQAIVVAQARGVHRENPAR